MERTGPALGRLALALRPYGRRALAALACGAAMVVTATTLPLVMRSIIDRGLVADRPQAVVHGTLALLGLGGALWLFAGARRALGGILGADVERDLRDRLGHHLLALEPAWHDRARTGQLLARAGGDLRAIRFFVSYGSSYLVLDLLTATIAVAQMWRLSPRLTLVALAVAPPLAVLTVRYGRRLRAVYRRAQDTSGDLTALAEENAAGVRVVKAFGREPEEHARFARVSGALVTENLRAARLTGVYQPLLGLLPEATLAAILWYGGRLVVEGTVSLGTLVAFDAYLIMLAVPLASAGGLFGMAQQAGAAAERVFEVLDRRPAITDRPGAAALPDPWPPGARVTFDGVGLRHEGTCRPALTGIDLDVGPGEWIAVVGGTGAGKSSLAGLVPRLYEPDIGRVTLDGHDIAGLTLDSVRGAVGLVAQEPVLFTGTLRENVAFGRPAATDDEIRAALATADVADLGLDTEVGERGDALSGGQRQRVALARALLTRPRVLVLDDALSQVDVQTEARILAALEGIARGVTMLMVTSRPACLPMVDRVVLLADGRIAAVGDHDELRHEPRYRTLWSDEPKVAS